MSKFPIMSFRWIFQLLNKLWVFFSYLCNKQFRKVLQYQPVKYDLYPLSPGELHKCFKLSASMTRWKNFPRFHSSVSTSTRLGAAKDFGAGSGRNIDTFTPWWSSSESQHQARNATRLYRKLHGARKINFSFIQQQKKNLWRCFVRKEEEKWDERNRRVKLSLYVRAGTR